MAVALKLREKYGVQEAHVGMPGGHKALWQLVIRHNPFMMHKVMTERLTWRYGMDLFVSEPEDKQYFVKRTKTSRLRRLLVQMDAFLETYEWRKLRMEALKLYGARCQCCGATAKDGIRIHVDHIKPRKDHPELALELSNLQVLCGPCNHGKGNWDSTDWR